MNKILLWFAVLLGLAFVALAFFYWVTPAGALPTFLPGYIAGSSHVHFKHGLAALILGLGVFTFAWFASGPTKKISSERE